MNSVLRGEKGTQTVFFFECFVVSTWHDRLVAGYTLGGELVAEAVAAYQRVALAGERLVCQRAVASETAKTVRVVIFVFIEELLEEEERECRTD